VHAAAVDADDGLGQEGRGHPHAGCDLATEQFVELDLVGRGDGLDVAVVDLELRRRDFRVVFLVLEPERALDLGGGINEGAQRVAGERVVVAAGIDVVEPPGLGEVTLGVFARKEEAFDFVGGVKGVALFLVELVGIFLEHAAQIAGVRSSILVDDLAEDKDLSRTEDVGGHPVKGAPVDPETKVALPLRGETANRGTIEGQVIEALDEEFLVVVEHVQAAFEVAEQDRDRLDVPLIGEILDAFFLDDVGGNAVLALLFYGQVFLFEFFVAEGKEIAKFGRHASPKGGGGKWLLRDGVNAKE